MSSAKSDESSCHSEAEPDSVATWRRRRERCGPPSRSSASSDRRRKSPSRSFFGSSVPRTARARPSPRTWSAGAVELDPIRPRAANARSRHGPHASRRPSGARVRSGRARRPWPRRPCGRPIRPSRSPRGRRSEHRPRGRSRGGPARPARGSSEPRAEVHRAPSPRRPVRRRRRSRSSAPSVVGPGSQSIAGDPVSVRLCGLPAASKFRRLSSALYWRSSGDAMRLGGRDASRSEHPTDAAGAPHPLGVSARRPSLHHDVCPPAYRSPCFERLSTTSSSSTPGSRRKMPDLAVSCERPAESSLRRPEPSIGPARCSAFSRRSYRADGRVEIDRTLREMHGMRRLERPGVRSDTGPRSSRRERPDRRSSARCRRAEPRGSARRTCPGPRRP